MKFKEDYAEIIENVDKIVDSNVAQTVEKRICNNKRGMEMVQVAILVAIAIGIGLIFKDRIGDFVSDIFNSLEADNFSNI